MAHRTQNILGAIGLADADADRERGDEHGRTIVCATHDPALVAAADAELALRPS